MQGVHISAGGMAEASGKSGTITDRKKLATPKTATAISLSFGIDVCRINPKTRRLEAILAQNRYTYAFHKFVLQKVSVKKDKSLAALFAEMTAEEHNDIRSLNFAQMWYRVWLSNDVTSNNGDNLYTRKFAKFTANFIAIDAGKRLLQILNSVRPAGSLIWDLPGGKKKSGESDISCAIREFEEETNIPKSRYRIIPDVRRRTTFRCAGVKYVKIYYVAVATAWLANGDCLERTFQGRDIMHAAEIGNVGWFDIERIRQLDNSHHLEMLLAPLFRLAKRAIRGKRTQHNSTDAKKRDAPPAPNTPNAPIASDAPSAHQAQQVV